jgi:hypothetical protein
LDRMYVLEEEEEEEVKVEEDTRVSERTTMPR